MCECEGAHARDREREGEKDRDGHQVTELIFMCSRQPRDFIELDGVSCVSSVSRFETSSRVCFSLRVF